MVVAKANCSVGPMEYSNLHIQIRLSGAYSFASQMLFHVIFLLTAVVTAVDAVAVAASVYFKSEPTNVDLSQWCDPIERFVVLACASINIDYSIPFDSESFEMF